MQSMPLDLKVMRSCDNFGTLLTSHAPGVSLRDGSDWFRTMQAC